MDLLYQRYASPFDYLDSLLLIGQLEKGVLNVLEQDNEDRLWQLYLHSLPYNKQSYNDWKKGATKANVTELSEDQIKIQVNKAENILKTFHIERG